MKAEAFLDTNVLVYAFAPNEPDKRKRALALLSADDWCVSWQVIQEFANVALHKFESPMRPEDLEELVARILWPRCTVLPSIGIWHSASRVHQATGYRFFDSLIVAGALASGARVLLTEDLQHDRKVGDLRIVNPFR
jgi:predicted nucleic acid-binding protein